MDPTLTLTLTQQVEPWLLAELPDFYGDELRLVVGAYIRPEASFTTLENLVRMYGNTAQPSAPPPAECTRAASAAVQRCTSCES